MELTHRESADASFIDGYGPVRTFGFMENLPEVATLKSAMQSFVREEGTKGHQALEDAVCVVVDVLKAAGWPVEGIIVLVKKTAREIGYVTTRHSATSTLTIAPAQLAVDAAVRACIEHYYKSE